MKKDSLSGETILWSGSPESPRVPRLHRFVAAIALIMCASTLALAIVVAMALHRPAGPMIAFAAWCATVALGAWQLPLVWLAKVRYFVTDRHVVWKRGPLRRTIPRAEISYAVIRWSDEREGVGDLVLERAVPTGALRRTLSIELLGVKRPDHLLDVIRGAASSGVAQPLEGAHPLPLAQRLGPGERVLWSEIPTASPWSGRRTVSLALAAGLVLVAVRMLAGFVPAMEKISRAHALSTFLSALLIGAVSLVVLLLAALAASVVYTSWIRPWILARRTRYFVTNQRVLIRRGPEELHLDRARIAYVIMTPLTHRAARTADIFLVLDGPQARALSVNGAFGGTDGRHVSGFAGAWSTPEKLRPVFTAIGDAETATEILGEPLRHAA